MCAAALRSGVFLVAHEGRVEQTISRHLSEPKAAYTSIVCAILKHAQDFGSNRSQGCYTTNAEI
jgi:hypothetical protein